MRHEFVAGERIILNDGKFIIEDRKGDVVKLYDEDKNKCLVRKQKFLVEELFGGNLRFVQQSGADADSEIPRAEYYVDLCDRDRDDARRKLSYVQAALEQNIEKSTKEALSPVIEYVFKETGEKKPAPITLYRWRRDYIVPREA